MKEMDWWPCKGSFWKDGGYLLYNRGSESSVVVLCPSQQFFSHVGMISCLPGLNQY